MKPPSPSPLALKITPPRLPRHLLQRPRLSLDASKLLEAPVLLVQAPAGYGKTSLLAQWRREQLLLSVAVAWLSAHAADDPRQLLQGLALSIRTALGRPGFGQWLLEAEPSTPIDGLTALLAEMAHAAHAVLLVIDEVDRLQPPARETLAYLIRNAPQNLRVVVAARADCDLGLDDLVAYGHAAVVGPSNLRFTFAESLALMRQRLGPAFDADNAARLHDFADGWPLGLQLAVNALAQASHWSEAMTSLTSGDGLRQQLDALMLGNLAHEDIELLTRIAVADPLHPELCVAMTGEEDSARRLLRLAVDTPVFVAAEQGDWLRLHALARELLRRRFATLPTEQQAQMHERASAWFAQQGLREAAARHALAAGKNDRAYELAEQSLYESLTARGQQGGVLEWIERLPAAELEARPRLLLTAAWALALSERHGEARRLVERLEAHGDTDASLRCECALILSGAAVFADQPDRFAELHDPWADAPPLTDPLLRQIHANRRAFRALLEGEPAQARQRLPLRSGGVPSYVTRWSELIAGLSYLWEGRAERAEAVLAPALAHSEQSLGRRSSFACMLAALLATACWEQDRAAEADALLADRLDVIERSGLPETVLLAYRTLARMALAGGSEHRALELLEALDAVGAARGLPRLRVVALTEQVRIHARHHHAESCAALLPRLDALLAEAEPLQGRLGAAGLRLQIGLAQAFAAMAASDWHGALAPLEQAGVLARQFKLGRLHVEVLGLRALALVRCGERADDAPLQEAVSLATRLGLRRVFDDAHPALGDWVRQRSPGGERPSGPPPPPPELPARVPAAAALTPKEGEILELLARNLTNKEIGRAIQASDETVKWHVRNLFIKLDAGTRRQVVARARILGLLVADA